MDSKTLDTVIRLCELASSEDVNAREKWAVQNMDEAIIGRLVDIIQMSIIFGFKEVGAEEDPCCLPGMSKVVNS
ncbi:unnamed protein product [Arabis nemorensis]|uniref:Uncharacterized protein n=1 Tax=Arabis nemorensis TaxID=586526 RepID=A0A565CGL4_9BRAS|nr:unnamed protein product [Arabis nemorensis]